MKENSKNFKLTKIEMIPKEWEIVGLGNIVEVYDSKRIPLSKMERREIKGIYPYCGANGIIDYINDYIFDGEFVLLAEDGGSYNKFGKTAYLMSGKFWVNNHAHILNARKGTTTNLFLLNVLNFFDLNPYIVGSTRTKMNQEQMRRIKLPLPPLPEQQKIAEILSTVDKAIEKVDEAIKKTQKLKKGMMQELLTKGIGHKEFKNTEIGRIPKEWEIYKIKNIGNIITGKTPSTKNKVYWNGNIPFITPADIKQNKYINNTKRNVSNEGVRRIGYILPKEAVVVVCIGSTIGKIGITSKESVTNQQNNSIICKKKINPHYVYYALLLRNKILKSFSGIAAVPIINKTLFGNLEITIPPLPEQQKIAEILSTVDSRLEMLRKRKGKLERVKKGLMNDLLTGRKRVRLDS